MIEIGRILCPTDFSETSRHALDHAAALARAYECRVTLLYVHPPLVVSTFGPGLPLLPGAVLSPEDRQAALGNLREFADAEVGHGLDFDYMVSEGEAAAEIVQAATDSKSDMIVLGTHGRTGFQHLAMGSVAEKVLRRASCPVMTVPPRTPDVVPVPSALFRRVLCAIDFSESSMLALRYACAIAQEAGGQFTVLHALELLPEPGPDASWATQTVGDYFASLRADSETKLAQSVPSDVRQYCEVETVMVTGTPYREILKAADS